MQKLGQPMVSVSHIGEGWTADLLVKASRRITDTWSVAVRGSYIRSTTPTDALFNFRQDSFGQLEITRYFLP